MQKTLLVSALFLAGVVSTAVAAPRALDCQVAGAAGSYAFQFVYDEENRSASAIWASPRPFVGRSGVDESTSPTISVTEVSAGFNPLWPDPGGYFVRLNRTNGSVMLTMSRAGGNITDSAGQCRHSTAPISPF